MTSPANSVAWFEIGTADPDEAEQFYGSLFGWTFAADAMEGMDYRIVTTGLGHPLQGGLAATGGARPNYSIISVQVDDVPAAASEAERLGGTVVVPPETAPTGLAFAYLADPSGNQFGIFSPPPEDD
jgi:uncharacterized protein